VIGFRFLVVFISKRKWTSLMLMALEHFGSAVNSSGNKQKKQKTFCCCFLLLFFVVS
jgi:hypothetical protein